jgi:hypothetical protein
MEHDMDEGSLYLVRVWRYPGDFRASVRSVSDERLHLFTAPDDLARYFAQTGIASAEPLPAARHGSSDVD